MSNKYPGGIITSGANAGYSVAFDGTGDYLTVPDSAALEPGSSNFTIECWVYPTANGSFLGVFSKRTNNSTDFSPIQVLINSGTMSMFASTNGTSWAVNQTASSSPPLNAWSHIAVVRNGTGSNNLVLYLNGVSVATGSVSNTALANNAGAWAIGADSDDGGGNFAGYISGFRIVIGSAVYTSTFTPPTQLLNITNTQLLTCNSPAIVDQSSNNFTITANGNAAVSTFTPFTGTQLVPNPNTLANTQGVWSISDAAYWMSQNKWPMPPNYPLQSLRFNSADSANLTRTPGSATNRKTWTWSGWVKRSKLGAAQIFFSAASQTPNNQTNIIFTAGDALSLGNYNGSTNNADLVTTSVYRDVSAWYHIVVAVDTTQATASNRIKLYVNGVQITAFSTSTYFAQNDDTYVNSTKIHSIGRVADFGTSPSDIMLADVYLIDGQALTPSSFGANDPNTGVWSPVPYSGTYGTNGFRLSFQDNTGTTATTLGKDYSGNGNNWTPNNFSVAAGSGNDSLTDGPTNWGIDYGNGGEVRGNYATLNPLNPTGGTFSNGNLDWTSPAVDQRIALSTMEINGSSKWYCEFTIGTKTGTYWHVGVFGNPTIWNPRLLYRSDGARWIDNTSQTPNWASYTTGDIIGISYDGTTGAATFYKNGALLGSMTTPTPTASQYFGCASDGSGGTMNYSVNFGQRPFAYPAPSGFKVLCTTNLPIPTVGATSTTLASRYMDVLLYTGNGSSRSITGLNFQPDFVWIKSRSSASWWHQLQDAVRGATKRLASNETATEATDATTLTSFNSDGFSLGTSTSYNNNTDTYVAWNWNAGGSTVTNTSGSISSQVRANTTAGVSVVTYTGNGSAGTIGHGLGVAPKMVIAKRRDNVSDWAVYHVGLTSASYYVYLNSTQAQALATGIWNGTAPTSSVASIGSIFSANGGTYVAYCFAEIAGFSRFGSYTGNGSADGTFIYLGFRPRFIMGRDATGVDNWWIYDSARNTYNVANSFLRPNLADAEGSNATDVIDFLSNGFKIRGASNFLNENGNTFIYAAFAESPFNYSRAR